MRAPVQVGLVGAGPWAEMVHAPMLAAGPEIALSGVWARRPEAAGALAERFGTRPFGSFEELLDNSEAVAFAVPPAVQADLAIQAAAAGKGVLLEKPVAENLVDAERVADAIGSAGVVSIVTLTYRFAAAVRDFISEVSAIEFRGGRSLFLTNAYLGGPFATEWRLSSGSLLDIGPHAIDLLEATVGPVVAVRAAHGARNWTAVTLEHANGAVSQVSLCSHAATDPLRIELDLYNEEVTRWLDVTKAMGNVYGEILLTGNRPLGDAEAFQTLRSEFAHAVRSGEPHALDVQYGLRLQRIVDAAGRDLATAGERVL